ncbi:amidase signature enzyme [Xylariaceae sp. FL0016]|nr:amidase signature enzyme [Xylariaceae sp. FL0016]
MGSINHKSDISSVETMQDIARSWNFQMTPKEAEQYLATTEAAQASVDLVDAMPDYIDPRLKPDLGLDETSRKYTEALEKENPLNAWIFRTHLEASTPTSKYGLLAGKTIAVKDTVSIAGVPMTCGTQPFHLSRDSPYPVPVIDAPIVSRVLAAGATVTGTSTCENYCLSAMSCTSATGPVENPWAPGYSAGGSSSGSAALVAVDGVRRWRGARGLSVGDLGQGADFAVGGDQGGSIRVPAAYCGIYGMKPTHGLVPYTGLSQFLPLIDHAGPMAASVRDNALLLSVLAGYDGFDPRMTPETPLRENVPQYHELLDRAIASRTEAGTWTPGAAGTGLRIGVLKEAFEVPGMDPTVASVIRDAASRFEGLGASVREASVPLHAQAPHIFTAATRASLPASFTAQAAPPTLSHPFPGPPVPRPDQAWFDAVTRSNPLVAVALLSGEALSGRHPESVRHKALRHVHGLRAAYDAALRDCDVLVMPATPTAAVRHAGEDMGVLEKAGFLLSNTVNTMPFNVTGHPGFVMPVGWVKSDGDGEGGVSLPVGMQIVGRRWREMDVYLAAAAWEVGGLGLDENFS